MTKIKFTKTAIDSIPICQGTRIDYRIEDHKYLRLRVSLSKIFIYYRKIKGQKSPKKITIGEYPILPLEKIKERYDELNFDFSKGKISKISKTITFGELFQLYCQKYEKIKKTISNDIHKYNKNLIAYKDYPITKITYDIVKEFHDKHKYHHAVLSNRCLALISSLYKYAQEGLHIEIENPAKGIKKHKESPRTRILTTDEKQRFLETLVKWRQNQSTEDFIDLLRCFYYIGQRKTRTMQMKFTELNLDTGEWNIPRSLTKNEEALSLTLHDEAIAILKSRRKKIKGDNVFPSPVDPDKPISEIKRQWKTFLKDAKITNLTFHDLRRSLGSYLLMSSGNIKLVQEVLGHSNIRTTAKVYAHLTKDYKRKEINKVL